MANNVSDFFANTSNVASSWAPLFVNHEKLIDVNNTDPTNQIIGVSLASLQMVIKISIGNLLVGNVIVGFDCLVKPDCTQDIMIELDMPNDWANYPSITRELIC